MKNCFQVVGFATGLMLAGVISASAATVSVIASSTQGVGNQADVFAPNHTAYTNGGASWDADPTWTVPPGNEGGISQSPFNNTTLVGTQDYFSVIYSGAPGDGGGAASPATLTFGKAQTAFNMLWGSIDSYNKIEFFSGGSSVAQWNGTDIINAGDLGGSSNNFEQVALLRFNFDDASFDSVKFVSDGQNSFEFALAPVPLPAAGFLLFGALGGLAALRRRRKSA